MAIITKQKTEKTKGNKRGVLGKESMITLTAPSQIWGHTKLVEFQLTIKLNHKSDKGHTQPAAATIQRFNDCWRLLWSPFVRSSIAGGPPPLFKWKLSQDINNNAQRWKKLNYQWGKESRRLIAAKVVTIVGPDTFRWVTKAPHHSTRRWIYTPAIQRACVWHTLNCHINLNAD